MISIANHLARVRAIATSWAPAIAAFVFGIGIGLGVLVLVGSIVESIER